MTARLTQPLRDEHKALMQQVEDLRAVADAVGMVPSSSLQERIGRVCDFLNDVLIPHAQAEDRALYPLVGKVMRGPEGIETMSRDHLEVSRLTDELRLLGSALADPLDAAAANAARRIMYGLYALITLHFAKEESIYLPVLDARLNPGEARAMFEAMDRVAKDAKAARAVH